MADPEHLEIIKQGATTWNQWLDDKLRNDRDWRRGIKNPDFSFADLRGVDLRGANLWFALLYESDLREVELGSASLYNTYLNGANLSRANLSYTDLFKTELKGALFHEARFNETLFRDVDLSVANGLEKTIHEGPSTIGIDTIFRSQGNIPETFLRGCGVPDIFIEYSRSFISKPIQFFSSFISHSHHDQRFCDRLYADLQAKSVRVWYFPEDAKWGEPVWGEIDRSIKIYDKLILVCSKHSLTSGPVLREIERALNREDKEGKNILFPITVDDYVFDGWEHPRKVDVLAKVVGDFRGWNRSANKYDAAMKKLLMALKLEKA